MPPLHVAPVANWLVRFVSPPMLAPDLPWVSAADLRWSFPRAMEPVFGELLAILDQHRPHDVMCSAEIDGAVVLSMAGAADLLAEMARLGHDPEDRLSQVRDACGIAFGHLVGRLPAAEREDYIAAALARQRAVDGGEPAEAPREAAEPERASAPANWQPGMPNPFDRFDAASALLSLVPLPYGATVERYTTADDNYSAAISITAGPLDLCRPATCVAVTLPAGMDWPTAQQQHLAALALSAGDRAMLRFERVADREAAMERLEATRRGVN